MTDPFPTDVTLQVIPWQMLMNYYLVSRVETFTAVAQHLNTLRIPMEKKVLPNLLQRINTLWKELTWMVSLTLQS